jgi:hypothetical protein
MEYVNKTPIYSPNFTMEQYLARQILFHITSAYDLTMKYGLKAHEILLSASADYKNKEILKRGKMSLFNLKPLRRLSVKRAGRDCIN